MEYLPYFCKKVYADKEYIKSVYAFALIYDEKEETCLSWQILDVVRCYRPQNAIISYGRSCLKTGNWCCINASQASGSLVRNLQTCI